MKKIVLSLVALLTSLSLLTCFVAHCADEDLTFEEIIEETINSMLISSSGLDSVQDGVKLKAGFEGLFVETYLKAYEALWLDPNNSDGYLEFTVPNIDIVTGKYMLHWVLEDGTEDDVLVECTVILSDKPDYLTNLPPIKVREYGDVYYYANCLNYMITHSDGEVKRYLVSYPTGFNYTSPTFATNTYSLSSQTGCTVFEYRGGTSITSNRPIKTAVRMPVVRFNTSTVNSIRKDLSDIYTPSSSYNSKPAGFYGYNSGISASSPISYPADIDIILGVGAVYMASSGSGSSNIPTFNWNTEFMCSFATTNNPAKGNQLITRWTTPQTQNYYYNDYIQGGTTINETNVNNYFDGAFLPAFDIDPDLPLDDIIALLTDLAPDFQLAMRPTLDLSTGDLFDRLVDFYGNMPDINLDWDTPLDNDYWDIEFPPIPDSGGGSGGDITVYVTVDITRPLITTYQYTDPLEIASLPQITTYTMPVSVQDSAKSILDTGEDVLQDSGLIPIYAFLTLIGIGVAIIFKGV